MHIQYTITMTPEEREKYRQIALATKEILRAYADSIEDSNEQNAVWDKIRNFNQLMEVFKTK